MSDFTAMAGRRRVAADPTGSFPDDITSPLMGKDGATVATSVDSDDRDSAAGDPTSARPTALQIAKAFAALVVAAAGAATSIASIIFVPEIIVYIAGGICVAHFPFVTYRERKLLSLSS